MSFEEDLKVGQAVERQVLKKLQSKYPLSFMIDGEFKAFDIFIPEISKGVEVKYDRRCEETGNVCIEIECNSKDSALMTDSEKIILWNYQTNLMLPRMSDRGKNLQVLCD